MADLRSGTTIGGYEALHRGNLPFSFEGGVLTGPQVGSLRKITIQDHLDIGQFLRIGLSNTTTPTERLEVVGGSIMTDGSLKILNGTTLMGEIHASDTAWLRINQSVDKPIYTPRGIRADNGMSTGNYSLVSNEIRSGLFRAGNSSYYVAPDNTSVSGLFAGKIGIGTTTPATGLHVVTGVGGDGSWANGIRIENTSATVGEAAISFTNAGTGGTGANNWILGLNQGDAFQVAYGTSFVNGNVKMSILSNGSVGILNLTPSHTLDVTGNINSTLGYIVGGTTVIDGLRNISGNNMTLTGNLTLGTTSQASDTVVKALAGDLNKAGFEAHGGSQGTGYLYVGQDINYGGGIEYNGDNNPTTTGAGSDYIALYRKSNGINEWTARNIHANNDWEFRANVKAVSFTGNLTGNVTGTLTGNITGNAATVGNLSVHTGTNNEANKVVRTDANGYINVGWLNTVSGDAGTGAITRVYASTDAFVRYYTLANFSTQVRNLSTIASNIADYPVSNYLRWANGGNSHVIIDASKGLSPTGGVINNTNAAVPWSATYPTLVGWNGTSTYGVRVDSARRADSAATADSVTNADTVDGKHASEFAPSGYGLGTTCKSVTGDWNTHVDTGFYMGSALTNSPPATNGSHTWWYVLVMLHNTSPGWVLQTATDFNNKATYRRARVNGTWSSWVRLAESIATPLTTEKHDVVGMINELFQYASDGKLAIKNAIIGKGGQAYDADSFTTLGGRIEALHVGYQGGDTIETSALIPVNSKNHNYFTTLGSATGKIGSLTDRSFRLNCVCSDAEGNVYYVDSRSVLGNRLVKLKPDYTVAWTFTGHGSSSINQIDYRDGSVYTAGYDDGTVKCVAADTGLEVWSYTNHTGIVNVCADPVNQFVYSGGRNDNKVIKMTTGGAIQWTYPSCSSGVTSLSVNPNSPYDVFVGESSHIQKLTSAGGLSFTLSISPTVCKAVSVSGTTYLFVTIMFNSTLYRYNVNGGLSWSVTPGGVLLTDLTTTVDGHLYVSDTTNKRIVRVNASSGATMSTVYHTRDSISIHMSKDNRLYLDGGSNTTVICSEFPNYRSASSSDEYDVVAYGDYIYAAGHERVVKYDKNYNPVTTVLRPITGVFLGMISSVCVESSDIVYLTYSIVTNSFQLAGKLEKVNMATGEVLWTLDYSGAYANKVTTFATDVIVGLSNGQVIRITPSGATVWTNTNNTASINAISKDATYIFTASNDGTLRRLNSTGTQSTYTNVGSIVLDLIYDQKTGYFYYCSGSGYLIRKINSGFSTYLTISGSSVRYAYLAIDKDGCIFAGSEQDILSPALYKYNTSGTLIAVGGREARGICMDASNNLAVATRYGLQVYYQGPDIIWTVHGGGDAATAVATDASYIYTSTWPKTVHKRYASNGNPLWSFTGHTNGINGVSVDNAGNVYTASSDNSVRKLNSSGGQTWSFTGHTSAVYHVHTTYGDPIYTCSADKTVRRLNSSGSQVWSFTGHTSFIEWVWGDVGGYYVYTASDDKTVRKLDANNGAEIWSFNAGYRVKSVMADTLGFVYYGDTSNRVRRLSPEGKLLWTYMEHTSWVNSVEVDNCFNVYTASSDGTVRKLDVNGKEEWRTPNDLGSVYCAVLDPTGNIYFATQTGTLNKIPYNPTGSGVLQKYLISK